jgi:hypothetical protein
MTIRDIIGSHPRPSDVDREVLVRCIEECLDCAGVCTGCADACLAEPDVAELVGCIRRCLDCADVCIATARVSARQTETDRAVLRQAVAACASECRACGDECERHAAHHVHCRICAETCRRCEAACDALVAALG